MGGDSGEQSLGVCRRHGMSLLQMRKRWSIFFVHLPSRGVRFARVSRAETWNPDKQCEADKLLHCLPGSAVSDTAATVWARASAGHGIGPGITHGADSVRGT